jgi:hypothetical protein
MEALSASEMSILTRVTRRNILEDAILHSHRRENLKSYEINVLCHFLRAQPSSINIKDLLCGVTILFFNIS